MKFDEIVHSNESNSNQNQTSMNNDPVTFVLSKRSNAFERANSKSFHLVHLTLEKTSRKQRNTNTL